MKSDMQYVLRLFLMTMGLIMGACASNESIYTSASYSTLPASGGRVSVVGSNMTVLATVETWLQDRGLYVIDRNTAQGNAATSTGTPCHEWCDTTATLEAARTVGADYVIIFKVSMEHAPERLSIIIKSLATKTGEEIFRAESREFLSSDRMDAEDKNEALNHLTCHALATVWRYRPGGPSDDRSDHYCHMARPQA
jgi:hypothetical protein